MPSRDTKPKKISGRWGRVLVLMLLAILTVVAIGVGTGLIPVRLESTANIPPPKATVLSHVGAWGRLVPRGEIRSLAAPSAADGTRIAKLNVVEGQRVSKEDVIAVLDSHERRLAAVEHARSMLALAEAKLEQVRLPAKQTDIVAQEALIAKLQHEQHQAEQDLKRELSLSERKVSVESMLEQARLRLNQAVQNRRHAEAQLESLKSPRPTDVSVAERQVDEARALVKQMEADLALTEIRSPSDATVLRVIAREGEKITDRGVAIIGDVDQMYAIAEVYEGDLARVKIGQLARVRIPTLKLEIPGEVDRMGYVVQKKDVFNIDPVADTDARVIEVWIRLPEAVPDSVRKLSNARVEVTIDVGPSERQPNSSEGDLTEDRVPPRLTSRAGSEAPTTNNPKKVP